MEEIQGDCQEAQWRVVRAQIDKALRTRRPASDLRQAAFAAYDKFVEQYSRDINKEVHTYGHLVDAERAMDDQRRRPPSPRRHNVCCECVENIDCTPTQNMRGGVSGRPHGHSNAAHTEIATPTQLAPVQIYTGGCRATSPYKNSRRHEQSFSRNNSTTTGIRTSTRREKSSFRSSSTSISSPSSISLEPVFDDSLRAKKRYRLIACK
ncbi:unnamed protein product [Trichogramma brassicae]|uniref:Uncharacterized protein n=1 Tax=Trichogramma brassicae TaxID=86971 RepID=A0A6H5I9E2_9HYME|nr:unnamed protein product [Trichogramma brassicae]